MLSLITREKNLRVHVSQPIYIRSDLYGLWHKWHTGSNWGKLERPFRSTFFSLKSMPVFSLLFFFHIIPQEDFLPLLFVSGEDFLQLLFVSRGEWEATFFMSGRQSFSLVDLSIWSSHLGSGSFKIVRELPFKSKVLFGGLLTVSFWVGNLVW